MGTTLEAFKIKSVNDVRDDYLRTWRNAMIARGVPDPDVSSGTEIYGKATALAQQIFVASAGIPAVANAQMPDSALGDDLVRQAKVKKLDLRPASGSHGPIILEATVTTPIAIATGAQLLDSSSQLYKVSVGGNYSAPSQSNPNPPPIPIDAISLGSSTNLAPGAVLRWVAPPPFVTQTATVGPGGLTEGRDADTIEILRGRLLDRHRAPSNGANWASGVLAAEASTPAVQKAFAHPACNGPSTIHFTVVRAPTATNKGRDVDATTMSTLVAPTVLGGVPSQDIPGQPEYVEVVTKTVVNQPTDVAFGLALPSSPLANPQGPGGGWTDANPFPTQLTPAACAVSAVVSSSQFTVYSDTAPVVGSQVCWLSTDDWVLRTANVTAFLGGPFWLITIDSPFVSAGGVVIGIGDYVFPNAANMAAYVQAVLDGFGAMGPGEKTSVTNLLPRALRRPLASGAGGAAGPLSGWLSQLRKGFLRVLEDAGEEVATASYLSISPSDTPALPSVISAPPAILTPGNLGFYPI